MREEGGYATMQTEHTSLACTASETWEALTSALITVADPFVGAFAIKVSLVP